MPAAARSEFDRLLTLPLQKTPAHKKELLALRDQLGDASPAAQAAVARGLALLEAVERKTSPLYLRLIHAAARYLCLPAGPDTDWALRLDVVRAVAHSTKNFELVAP